MRTGSITSIPAPGGGAMTQICGPSNTRVLIHIRVDLGVGYVTDQAGAPPLTGIPVTPSAPLTMRIEDYGDLVHHGYYGSDATGGAQFSFTQAQQPQPSVSGNAGGIS